MSAPASSATTGGLTRKIIQRMIYGAVALVALLLILTAALVHHFTFDACANIDGRQKKVPFGFHLEGENNDQCVADKPVVSTSSATVTLPDPPEDPEYPRSSGNNGNELRFATKDTPIKAWFDPNKTHMRGSRPARYELEGHPSVFWVDHFDGRDQEWWQKPPGRYLVTPEKGDDEFWFRWWQ